MNLHREKYGEGEKKFSCVRTEAPDKQTRRGNFTPHDPLQQQRRVAACIRKESLQNGKHRHPRRRSKTR